MLQPAAHPQSNMVNPASSNPTSHTTISDLYTLVRKIPYPICPQANQSSSTAAGPDQCCSCDRCKAANKLHKLKSDLCYIRDSLGELSGYVQVLGGYVGRLGLHDREGNFSPDLLAGRDFAELVSAVAHLKFQLPYTSYYEFPKDDENPRSPEQQTDPSASAGNSKPNGYDELNPKHKRCLWCFSVFPENAEIKKRVLINWWIGEDVLGSASTTANGRSMMKLEQAGEQLLQQLEEKKFIKRGFKKRRPSDSWSMEPTVRSFLLSEARDDEISAERVILRKSQIGPFPVHMANRVQTIFNVKGTRINIEAKNLAAMGSLKVFHLGRSYIPVRNQHIQVENFKFIEGLKNMKQLRVLSLQGISSLRELPNSVCGLKGLMILDLRACQALESLPSNIGNLKDLTHLDLSACFMLIQMPKGISLLSNLQVLKGFVIGHHHPKLKRKICTLHDLQMLKNLQTLSVFVLWENFPEAKDLKDLANFEELVKLKIGWRAALKKGRYRAGAVQVSPARPSKARTMFTCCFRNQAEENSKTVVFNKLLKLDLWCMPENAAKVLLASFKFPRLEKLYVRGSTFQHLTYNRDAEEEQSVAEEEQTFAEEDGNVAEEQGEVAETELIVAEAEQEVVEDERSVADEQQNVAEEEKNDAEVKPNVAVEECIVALELCNVADVQGNVADNAEDEDGIAEEQLQNAAEEQRTVEEGQLNVVEHEKWKNVNTLRLLSLPNLVIEWKHLMELFPNLTYLEKNNCPKLNFARCNQEGVWEKNC